MKKIFAFSVVAVLMLIFCLLGVAKAGTKISGSVDVGYLSSYMGGNSGGTI